MTSQTQTCLRCGREIGFGVHPCAANLFVIDPKMYSEWLEDAHPLDRLTVKDVAIIRGENVDEDEIRQRSQEIMEEMDNQYFDGPLTHRVEFINISGTGFQGGVEYFAYTVEGHEESHLREAVDILNADSPPFPVLDPDDTYFCRLVSLDKAGIRYVWIIRQIIFNKKWILF